jgi:hypothetical protein
MFRNLIEKANYSNLSDKNVHFNYEDYNLRMISPLRQSFNSLAVSFLDAGDRENALAVMAFAKANLYQTHLYPTYANLEAAEVFASLGDNESASALCSTLFDCHLAELKWQVHNGRNVDNLDRYLVQQAARMLAALGNSGPETELNKLGM